MSVGLMYSVAVFFCLLVNMVITGRALSLRRRGMKDDHLLMLLLFFIGFCVIDLIWGLFYDNSGVFCSLTGLVLSSYAFHIMSALSACVWGGYMIHFTGADGKTKLILNTLRYCLLAAQIILLFFNLLSENVFRVFEVPQAPGSYEYATGSARPVLFCLQMSNYVILMAYSLSRIYKNSERSLHAKVIFYSVIPLIFGFMQLLRLDVSMYTFGFTLSSVAIYIFYVTDTRERQLISEADRQSRKNNAIIQSISNDYEAIYYVDTATGTFDILYRMADGSIKSVSRNDDFFEYAQSCIAKTVYGEDLEKAAGMLTQSHIRKELADKDAFFFTCRIMLRGEPVFCEVRCVRSAHEDRGEEKLIFGVRNINEAVRAQTEQNRLLENALESARSSERTKTSFLFNMSHDIRTPMNAIIGFTGLAKKHINDTERVKECLEKVESAGDQLLSLVNDVLDMSRIESGKVIINEKPLYINKCVDDLISAVGNSAREKNIELICDTSDSFAHPWIYADELRLNRVMINILNNAIKFTKSGGKVVYTVSESASAEKGRVHYRFCVNDNGIGMSREFMSHLYEAFSREQNSAVNGIQSTGLGLTITKELVTLMNGTIDIQSTLGVGTDVTVDFDFRIAMEDGPKTHAHAENDLVSLKGRYALVVEDNPLNRDIALDILEDYGVTADTAEDGTAALQKYADILRTGSKMYDFILMDIEMPVMNGYKATAEIRNMSGIGGTHVPVIAMTANAFREDRQRALEAGMDAYIAKPINPESLAAILAGLIRK